MTNARVICWSSDANGPVDVLDRADTALLWTALERRGWLDTQALPVVVQVGRAGRSAVSVEIARSLCRYLATRFGITATVIDDAATADAWDPFPVRDLRTEEHFRVASQAGGAGVVVPRLWLEPCFLVTVAAISPSTSGRVACVLDAQADPLRALGNEANPAALVYEAHRLAASDLVVACTTTGKNDSRPRVFVAASPSDVQLEQAIARAAGLHARHSSFISALARHELVPVLSAIEGDMPDLRHCADREWRARLHGARARASASWRSMTHDLRVISGNLHKIPTFVRRRLAASRRKP